MLNVAAKITALKFLISHDFIQYYVRLHLYDILTL